MLLLLEIQRLSPRNCAKKASETGNLNKLLFTAFLGEIFSKVVKIGFKFVQMWVGVICFYCPVNVFSYVGTISYVEPLSNSE